MAEPLLKLDQATVVKGGWKRVLDQVSLAIHEGEHTAILGLNGSGKSSLMRLITRQHFPLLHADRRPAVTIFGAPRWEVFSLRNQLGIVSPEMDYQFAADELPGLEAVVSGFFSSQGIWINHPVEPHHEQAALAALELMDAGHLAARTLDTMSTGEVRRVLLARALVHDPRALLLDEPTTGLDLLARRRLLETLRGLTRRGKTLLLVTHHIEEIIPEIQRVILLQEGRVMMDGPKAEVLTAEQLTRLCGVVLEVSRRDGYYEARFSD